MPLIRPAITPLRLTTITTPNSLVCRINLLRIAVWDTTSRHSPTRGTRRGNRNMANVDTSIPARPTGAAAELAAAHAEEHPLKLYGGWFCPFVQRSWIVLHEKRIPHQYVEINPYRKAPDFLALNPRGLVPTLAVPVDEARMGKQRKPLYESVVICEYLDETYDDGEGGVEGKYGQSLLPGVKEDPYERARCRLWIDHISNKIVPAFYKFLQHTPEKDYSADEARANFWEQVKTLVREMDDGEGNGPWFLGDRFSMVDVMLGPWAKRLFLIDHYKPGGLGVPTGEGDNEGEEGEKVWRRWGQWFDAITSRQSVKDTWSDDDQYIASYKRYAEDTTNSQVGQATRKGEKLP